MNKKYLTHLAWIFILLSWYNYLNIEYISILYKLLSTLGLLVLSSICMALKWYLGHNNTTINIEDHLIE